MDHLNTIVNTVSELETSQSQTCVCYNTGLYSAIGILSFLVVAFGILSGILYRMYKREENLRLTMWKVKWKDFTWDQIEGSSSATSKHASSCTGVIEHSLHGGNKRAKHFYTSVGYYKGRLVAVKELGSRRMSLDRSRLSDLDQVFMLNHEHLCKFYGAYNDGIHSTVLTEYCTRGSLQDLLDDESEWDDFFKNSLIFDIVKGMLYLHRSVIRSHGNLKPSNCLIDSRFVVKITDFGVFSQRRKKKGQNSVKVDPYHKKLWTAPELLRAILPPQEGTQNGDVYSFAIIAQEILYQRGVFYRREDNFTPEEIIQRVTSPKSEEEEFRPSLEDDDYIIINEQWRKTLRKCWEEKPKYRIGFAEIHEIASGLQKENTLLDSLLQRLQKYSNRLEEKVEEKTEQYRAEKERSDNLLYQMLPKSVADGLKMNMTVLPESYESVTVYFSDIVGFAEICHKSKPLEVVQMLNDLYTMFDKIIDEFDVYKVETIGDAYMVVSGLPIRNDNHASEIAKMALRLRDSVSNKFVIKHMPNMKLKLRVGIHSGSVVAGVVGLKMPRYCLFGDTVNTAARMEQSGKELRIQISPRTKTILDKFENFELKKRDKSVFLKGIGEWNTWWLLREKEAYNTNLSDESPRTRGSFNITGLQQSKYRNSSTSSMLSTSSRKALTGDSSPEYDVSDLFTFVNENNNPDCRKSLPNNRTQRSNLNGHNNISWNNTTSNKQRRSGVTISPVPLLSEINLHFKLNRSSSYEFFRSLSMEEARNGCNLDTVEEDSTTLGAIFMAATSSSKQRRKTQIGLNGYPRDSGVSMAFDNIACIDSIIESET